MSPTACNREHQYWRQNKLDNYEDCANQPSHRLLTGRKSDCRDILALPGYAVTTYQIYYYNVPLEYAHVNGSTNSMRASRGPTLVSDPCSSRSKPSFEMFLRCSSATISSGEVRTYVIFASVNNRLAPVTRSWAMGPATAPMRYSAVRSVCTEYNKCPIHGLQSQIYLHSQSPLFG